MVNFIRINRLKLIGHMNRIDADRIPKCILNKLSKEIDLEVDPGIFSEIVFKIICGNVENFIGRRSLGIETAGKGTLGRRKL